MRTYLRELLRSRIDLDAIARTPGWTTIAIVAMAACWPLMLWNVLFPNATVGAISGSSHGWISSTLVVNLLGIAWLAPLMFSPSESRASAIGLSRADVFRGVVITLSLWAIIQGVLAAWTLGHGGSLALAPSLDQPGASFVLGALIAQLFGNALFEELLFRAFLIPQLYRRLRWGSPAQRLILSLLITQGAFAAAHIVRDLHYGAGGLTFASLLGWRLLWGMIFALVWLGTGNLVVTIAIHALCNNATPLLAGPEPVAHGAAVVLTLAVVLAWPLLERHSA